MKHFPAVGIIGVGWVGSQLKRYFEEILGYKISENLFLYDLDPAKCAGDISKAEVIFVTVPTPRHPENGSCNLAILKDAVSKIPGEKIVVLKSTIPPGTTEGFQNQYPQHKFLFNPEFLSERTAWQDMLRPDVQIVGFTGKSLDAAFLVLSLLPKAPFMSPWGMNTYQKIRLTATEAEFVKYAANLYFVRKVNWANALATAADQLGADYENIRLAMGADHRIGHSHLDVNHGGYRGFGGSCFPKDLDAFINFAKQQGFDEVAGLLQSDRNFNEALLNQQGLTIEDVSDHIDILDKKLKNKDKK